MNATMIQYVGETLRYLLASPPAIDPVTGENMDKKHNVKLAYGNGLRPDVWGKFKERFGIETIAEFYAATEAPFALYNLSGNKFSQGAIGRQGWARIALMRRNLVFVKVDWDTEVPARDPSTGWCIPVKSNEPGEMLYKIDKFGDPSSNFQGYFNNSKATSSKVLRDVLVKGDAYFRTGDVCKWDLSNGLIYFSDRIGDTFRWKSENVSTAEVSESLGAHPDVVEANVYGVEVPHHDGRAGCVTMTLKGPATPDTMRALASHVDASLPRYARPLFLRVVDGVGGEESTTGTNKQQKAQLRKIGVDPGAGVGRMFWRKGDGYVGFSDADWKSMQAGAVKL